MIVRRGIVARFGKLIEKAEKRTIKKMQDGRVETEPSATERFVTELENTFDEDEPRDGMVFRARTLRGIGRGAPEREFGADFCAVLNVDVKGYKQTKGFLSQAKSEGHGISVERPLPALTFVEFTDNSELRRLQGQVDKMLEVTPDSFVFVYSAKGFVVVPACSVKGLAGNGKLYAKPVPSFFKEYLMCFVGDPDITAYDKGTLEALREAKKARHAILFQLSREPILGFDS